MFLSMEEEVRVPSGQKCNREGIPRNLQSAGMTSMPSIATSAARWHSDEQMVQAQCSLCHSVDYITTQPPGKDLAFWTAIVNKMIKVFGAPLLKRTWPKLQPISRRRISQLELKPWGLTNTSKWPLCRGPVEVIPEGWGVSLPRVPSDYRRQICARLSGES